MEHENRTVTLSFNEFVQLMEDSIKLNVVLRAIYANVGLNYSKTALSYDGDNISLILSVIDGARYTAKLESIKIEKEIKS